MDFYCYPMIPSRYLAGTVGYFKVLFSDKDLCYRYIFKILPSLKVLINLYILKITHNAILDLNEVGSSIGNTSI